MTTIKQRHDKMFRKAMENLIVAKEFFDTYLPTNVKSIIDFSTLRIEKETFIEKKLKNKASDVLYSVNFNNKSGYIHLLLEHQSTVDPFMALRLFKYMLEICERHRNIHKDTKTLPVVYPMVFFNGTEPYTSPLYFLGFIF